MLGALVGAALLATGRGRGIERFGATREAFLASLAPLIAFPLVGALLLAISGHAGAGLVLLLLTLLMQLAPPVLSHALAVRWGREAEWARYATAYNWCQWALPFAGLAIIVALQVATGGRMAEARAANLLIGLLGIYALWLHWMVARHGLGLRAGRATLLVLLVNAGTAALVILPQLLREAIT